MTAAEIRIERAETAFDRYGYIVMATPIDGMEETFADKLWEGIAKIESFLGKKTSKKSIQTLHDCIPVP
jgi:hypothetical protein